MANQILFRRNSSLIGRLLIMVIMVISVSTVSAKEKTITFKKGERISIISSKLNPGKEQAMQEYFQKAFPLATSHGFMPLGRLNINAVKFGNYIPDTFIGIYSWPSRAAEQALENEESWPEIKAMRPIVWEELRINRTDAKQNLEWTFRDDRVYTVIFLWLSKDNPNDFKKYWQATKKTRRKLGAKTIAFLNGGFYSSQIEPPVAPDHILILEWPSSATETSYSKTRAFLSNKRYFISGVVKFEAFETTFGFEGS